MTSPEPMTLADAQLMIVEVVTDTLAWVFLDEDEPEYDRQFEDLRGLADLILTDLGLTVTAIDAEGTITAEIQLVDPDESDIPDVE